MSGLAPGPRAIEAAGTIETFAEGGAMARGATRPGDPGTDFLDVFGLSMFEPTLP